jgi:Ca2+-transporting ATPase
MEAALIAAAARCGVAPASRVDYPRVDEIAFDDARLRMTTVHRRPDGGFLVASKGAPEQMLAADGPIRASAEVRRLMQASAHDLAAEGYRVLAVAGRACDRVPAEPERDLRLYGLVALIDPIRPQAHPTVAAIDRAGIRLMLITGDHPATATAIARRVGLSTDSVVTGDALSDAVIPARSADGHGTPTPESNRPDAIAAVFARTRPEQKLTIVNALQGAGEVVAMTGDGVNDAPALRAADIGVAMGRAGTEAARQAADLVLADDNLATVAAAVEEGRRIYTNIRRFLTYALSGGLAEVVVMLVGPFLGLTVPLLPAQILWINMLTHGLPGVALGAEPADRAAMDRPPRTPDEAILGGGLTWRILATGGLISVVALGAAATAAATGRPWQSVLFTVLGLAQLGVALGIRGTGGRRNWGLDLAVGSSLVLQLGALWLAPLQALLGTESLSLAEIAACAAVAAVPGLLTLLARRRGARAG